MAGDGADRQEGRIGRAPLLAQGRQHDGLDGVEPLQQGQQRHVEPAGLVGLGRAHELVVEAEAVQECLQPRIVVRPETVVRAEGVAHTRQRQVQILAQHFRVWDALGHLAQPVHVVAEGDQARRPMIAGQGAEGVAHHGRARHLAEGAHVRQARRAIAGLKDHRPLQHREGRQRLVRLACVDQQFRRVPLGVGQALLQHMGQQIAGLFERPGLGLAGEGFEVLQHVGGLQSATRGVNALSFQRSVTLGLVPRAHWSANFGR
jgi:hypothetical protein